MSFHAKEMVRSMTKKTDMLTCEQAAAELGIAAGRLRAKALARGIGRKFGRAWAFTRDDLERLRESGARGPKPRAARGGDGE